MGKLNFHRHLIISRFYPTREIHENLMHAEMCVFTVVDMLFFEI